MDHGEGCVVAEFAAYPGPDGKTVFLTGGAGGIGAETARAFVEKGAKIGFVDLDVAAGRALLDEIGADQAIEHCDLRDIDALQAAFRALARRLGNADILVNNAAHDDRHDWQDVPPEYWDERTAANLRHMFFAIQFVAPAMIAAGRGSIINIGSNSRWEAGGGFPAYVTAKSAVHGLTRTMRVIWARIAFGSIPLSLAGS